MRSLIALSCILLAAQPALAQPGGKVLPLNQYACRQFAANSAEDAKKIVRSLIVMAWASGRSGPHGRISALPDDGALTRISSAVQAACRKAAQAPVMPVIWEQIDKSRK